MSFWAADRLRAETQSAKEQHGWPPVDFTIRGPIERGDLSGLCRRVCALLDRSGARVVVCDVAGLRVDAVAVEAIARLALAARRRECQITLQGGSHELSGLVAFMGLEQVLPVESPAAEPPAERL